MVHHKNHQSNIVAEKLVSLVWIFFLCNMKYMDMDTINDYELNMNFCHAQQFKCTFKIVTTVDTGDDINNFDCRYFVDRWIVTYLAVEICLRFKIRDPIVGFFCLQFQLAYVLIKADHHIVLVFGVQSQEAYAKCN